MSDFDALEEIKVGDLTVKIINDDEPSDPREGSDQLGVMACFHPEYTIGDKHRIDPHEFAGWDELERHLIRVEGALCVAPLYLYDHSGLQMKIGSFAGLLPQGHAEFDTMQVGFIYTTRQRMKEMCGWTRLTKKVQERVDKQLEAEVETYNQYLRGDVYGYIIEDEVGDSLESCWGFYGFDYCKQKAMSTAQYLVDNRVNGAPTDQLKFAL